MQGSRTRQISNVEYRGGTVVYHMCRDVRVNDNDALLYAQELALSHNAELVVVYTVWNYLWQGATRRFYDWVIPSLKEVEKQLHEYNIPLVIDFEHSRRSGDFLFSYITDTVGAVVVDQLPLRFMKDYLARSTEKYPAIALYEVDAHNCIPVWVTSTKQEFAAHTLRRKIHKLLPEYIGVSKNSLKVHNKNTSTILRNTPLIDWENVSAKIICDESVAGVGEFIPGERAAYSVLQDFLQEKLALYETSRNCIHGDGQSNLSPYIAHGNISRRKIIEELCAYKKIDIDQAFSAEANGSNGLMGSIASFVEECVVRAELAENYCFYTEKYDSYTSFPDWAKKSLEKAKSDKREYVYTYEQFAQASTHDDLWNAAQMQMVTTGKMHGYMRMYWAKKILEWSGSPEEAMSIAVKLNDIYELDGRDPNGYVGCAWSIGGVHDRPWFGRPIFGTVRYMAVSGVKKRGDIHLYCQRYLHKSLDKLFEV